MPETVVRPYSTEDVERLRGSVRIEHTLARLGAERLRHLLATRDWVPALGALTGGQAVQMVKAGLEAIYLSGWQVAADANAAVGLERDETERGEPAERLAHRGPADVEPLGERLLTEDSARRDDPRDDLVLELAGDVVGLGGDGAHGVDCTNHVRESSSGIPNERRMALAAYELVI